MEELKIKSKDLEKYLEEIEKARAQLTKFEKTFASLKPDRRKSEISNEIYNYWELGYKSLKDLRKNLKLLKKEINDNFWDSYIKLKELQLRR